MVRFLTFWYNNLLEKGTYNFGRPMRLDVPCYAAVLKLFNAIFIPQGKMTKTAGWTGENVELLSKMAKTVSGKVCYISRNNISKSKCNIPGESILHAIT